MTPAADTPAFSATALTDAWSLIGQIEIAHLVMLRDVGILDDAALASLMDPLEQTRLAGPPADVTSLDELVATFDLRLDALAPISVAGTATVARARIEVVATLTRLALRDDLLALAESLRDLREFLVDYAGTHLITLMPVYVDGQPAQPTTFAHFLGGLIGPLGRIAARLPGAMADLNRSPMGALMVASTGLPISRERVASLLGFDGPIPNTFDAIAATDHVATVATLAGEIAATLHRFSDELLTWHRTDPLSLQFAATTNVDPGLPQFTGPTPLHRLARQAMALRHAAASVAAQTTSVPYSPSVTALDALLPGSRAVLRDTSALLRSLRDALADEVRINQAYLANRAGKALTTSSDLATFFLVEEAVPPAGARDLAALVTRRAQEQHLEASHITADLIDAAALLTIGRELGIEIETLNRYLAPRRFLERREATGAPSQASTRAWLDQERLRIGADDRWRTETVARITSAAAERDRLVAELAEP